MSYSVTKDVAMNEKAPASLIINSPYDMPQQYWDQDANGKLLSVTQGRREAAYELYDTRNNTRRVEKLEQVNRIRERVDAWREAGYPGTTSVSNQLLHFWYERGEWSSDEHSWVGGPRQYPFYFCQLEAIETLIW
ncbi:MAG: type III restriction enzyme, partial [Oleispira sp.]